MEHIKTKDMLMRNTQRTDERIEEKLTRENMRKSDSITQIFQEKNSESSAFNLEHSLSNYKHEHKSSECSVVSNSTVSSLVKNFNSDMQTLIQQMIKEKASLHSQNLQLWKIIDKQRAMILELQKDLEKAFKEKKKYYNLWNELSTKHTPEKSKKTDSLLEKAPKKSEGEFISSLETPERQENTSVTSKSQSSNVEKSEFVLLFPGDKDFSILNASDDIFSSTLQSYTFSQNKELPLKPLEKTWHSGVISDKLHSGECSENSFSTPKGQKNNIFCDQLNAIPSPVHSTEIPKYRECSIVERTSNNHNWNFDMNEDLKSFEIESKKLSPIKRNEIDWTLNLDTNNGAKNEHTESSLSVHSSSYKQNSPAYTKRLTISSNTSQNYLFNSKNEHQIPSLKESDNQNQDSYNKYDIKDYSKDSEINIYQENIPLKQENLKTHESDLGSAISTSILCKTNLTTDENYLDKIGGTFDTIELKGKNTKDSFCYPSGSGPGFSIHQISSISLKILNSKLRMGKNREEIFFSIGVFQDVEKKELWRIEKNVQKILDFDDKLRRIAPSWKIPDITTLNTQNTTRVDQRKALLDQYLKYVLSIPLEKSTYLLLNDFLNTDIETQTKPQLLYDKYDIINEEYCDEYDTKSWNLTKKEGYLTKRGKNFGGWKSRYFVLDGPILKYYETHGGSQLGAIRLSQAQIGRQQLQTHSKSMPFESHTNVPYNDNSYRHAFLILEPKRNYSSSFIRHVLCAKSDKDCDEWVEALMQYIDINVPNNFTMSLNTEKKERRNFLRKHSLSSNTTHLTSGPSNINAYQFPNNDLKIISRNTQVNTKKQKELNSGEYNSSSIDNTSKNISIDFFTSPISNNLHGSKMTHTVSGSLSNIEPFDNNLSENAFEESLRLNKKYKKKGFWSFVNKDMRPRLSEQISHELRMSSSSIDLNSQIPNHNFRNIFGAPLSEAVSISRLSLEADILIPSVVYRCIEYLDNNNAEKEEGIYRLSGSNAIIRSLRDRFNTVGDVDLLNSGKSYDVHAIAGLLKLYLRELPTNILTRELHAQFLSVMEIQDNNKKLNTMNELVRHLPEENFYLLRVLISHLYRIVAHADLNKMTSNNVGIVFSPTLNIPAGIFSMFLIHYDTIFEDQTTLSTIESSSNSYKG
ncbi:hypothetical protein PCANB_000968 [Pneumocystis canis]|nr:hypothetical protein PCANB_000968 [Pneumocystis canis]